MVRRLRTFPNRRPLLRGLALWIALSLAFIGQVASILAVAPPAAPPSVTAALTPSMTTPVPPATPVFSDTVAVGWTDTNGGLLAYKVWRLNPATQGFDILVTTTAAGATSATDNTPGNFPTGVLAYQVCATNAGGTACSPSATTGVSVGPPTKPAGFAATVTSNTLSLANGLVSGTGSVGLSWTALTSNQGGFSIQRWDPGNATWKTLGYVGPAAIAFADSTAFTFPAGLQTYQLCALNVTGSSCATASAGRPTLPASFTVTTALTPALTVAPAATPLTGTALAAPGAATFGDTVKLTWPSTVGQSYVVSRFNASNEVWVALSLIPAAGTSTNYTDLTPPAFPAGTQTYKVCAVNAIGRTCGSNLGVPPPTAAANFQLTMTNTLTGVSLSTVVATSTAPTLTATANLVWSTSTGKGGYSISRWDPANVTWKLIQYAGPAAATYLDSTPGTFPTGPLQYELCGLNQLGVTCATTALARPGTPTLTAVIDNSSAVLNTTIPIAANTTLPQTVTGSKVKLTWAISSSTNLAGFVLYRWDATSLKWVQIAVGGPTSGTTGYIDLTPGTGVPPQYRVCALNLAGSSCGSSVVVSAPPAPTGLKATCTIVNLACSSVTLNWTSGSTQVEFAIFRFSGSSLDLVAFVPAATRTYNDPSPNAATRLYFVVSYNQFGTGGASATA